MKRGIENREVAKSSTGEVEVYLLLTASDDSEQLPAAAANRFAAAGISGPMTQEPWS